MRVSEGGLRWRLSLMKDFFSFLLFLELDNILQKYLKRMLTITHTNTCIDTQTRTDKQTRTDTHALTDTHAHTDTQTINRCIEHLPCIYFFY